MSLKLTTEAYKVHAALVQYVQQRDRLRIAVDNISSATTKRLEVAQAIRDWLVSGGTLLNELFGQCTEASEVRVALGETEAALARLLHDLATETVENTKLARADILDAQASLDAVVRVVQGVIGAIEVDTDFGSLSSSRRIFISYDTREVDIALWVAGALERRLNGRANVFVAKRDLGPGDDFLRVMLQRNLLQARALVAICSARSKTSPWLWWESSAVWAHGGLVIPLLVHVTPADFPGPLTLVCQGRQISLLAEVNAAIQAVLLRVDPDVSSHAITEDEFSSLSLLLSSHDPARHKFVASSSLDSPLRVYFGGASEVARALKLADACQRARESEQAIEGMRQETARLRDALNVSTAGLEAVEDKYERGGGWTGVSEQMSIHRYRKEFCEQRIATLREQLLTANRNLGAIQREIWELDEFDARA